MRLAILPIALLAAALSLAACGTPTTPSPTAPPDGGGGMVDATGDWILVEGTAGGAPIPIVAGSDITMSVAGSQISGRSACNQYGAEIIVADGAIRFGLMSMTAMACDDPVMAAEASFVAALDDVRGASLDGDRLTLAGDGVSLVFERLAPPPTADIVGTTWVLDTLFTADAATSVMGDRATLRLDEDGSLTGSTGCRTFTGRWTEANGEIVFADYAMDQTECDPALSDQDGHVVGVLGDGFRATVDGQRLTLTAQRNQGLGYVAED